MKLLIILLILSLLTGCQSTKVHNPDGVEQTQLAYIFKQPHDAFSNNPSAFINAIFDESGLLVMQFKPLQSAIKETYLAPGKYKFILQCNYGGGATDTEVTATVEAGASYRFSCGITSDKVYIGARILHKSYAIFDEVEI